jgi:tetratricopeptide (TPR) repeat protein
MSSCAAEADPLGAARRLRDTDGQADAALACYDRALALTPNARAGAGLYFELAALAHSSGRVDVLERSLRASVRLLPAFGDGHFELGNTLHGQNRYAEAVGSFDMALRQEQLGDRGMVYNNLANALTEVGHEQRAERAYAQGLRLVPRGSTAAFLLNGLANQQSARGRDEEAVATIERALRVQPNAHYAAFNLGNFLRRLKRIPEAELSYRRALAAEPSDARYVQGLGTVLHEAGRAQEAVAHYLSAQQLKRGRGERSVELERDLSSAMREAGRLAEALHVARGAAEAQPRQAESQLVLAAALREMGRVDEASEHAQLEARLDVLASAQVSLPLPPLPFLLSPSSSPACSAPSKGRSERSLTPDA